MIDSTLASGSKSGYLFTAAATAGGGGTILSTYDVEANPQSQNTTGVRSFCSVADAVVRYSTAAITTCQGTETPLQ